MQVNSQSKINQVSSSRPKYSKYRKKLIPFYFLLPLITVLVAFIFIPMVYSLYLSFHNFNLARLDRGIRFVGVSNYERFLFGGDFVNSLTITLIFTVGAVAIEMLLGFIIALIFCREFWFRRVIRTLILTPMMIAGVVVGVMWQIILHDQFGVFNAIVGIFGIPMQAWLTDPNLVLPSLILTDVWQFTPFVILILLSGMQSLPAELYEAASVDGASYFQKVKAITIPLLKPLLIIVATMRIMDAFRLMDRVLILTGGGPGTRTMLLNMLAFRETFMAFNLGYGAAISWIILLLLVTIGIILFMLSDLENTFVS